MRNYFGIKNKHVLYVTNVIFWLLGWASFGFSVWLHVEKNSYSVLVPASFSPMSAVGVVASVGFLVIFIVIVGFIGDSCRSKLMLRTYMVVVALLLIIHTVICVMGYVEKNDVRSYVKHALRTTINKTSTTNGAAKTDKTHTSVRALTPLAVTWDEMQSKLECCGIDSYDDWYHSVRWPKNMFVPDSCCNATFFYNKTTMHNCGKVSKNKHLWYTEGCAEMFSDWLLQHVNIIMPMFVAFVVIEVTIIITAVIHYRQLFKKPTQERRTGLHSNESNQECELLPLGLH